MTPTIKQIAKKANVSIATVSRALNNDVRVTEVTREKIIRISNDLNYKPNLVARNFVKKIIFWRSILPSKLKSKSGGTTPRLVPKWDSDLRKTSPCGHSGGKRRLSQNGTRNRLGKAILQRFSAIIHPSVPLWNTCPRRCPGNGGKSPCRQRFPGVHDLAHQLHDN